MESGELDMNTNGPGSAHRFSRTGADGASEILTLAKLTNGEIFVSEDLDGAEYPYLVQVTAGQELGTDFVGLYDLDGSRVDVGNSSWVAVTEAPVAVIEQIESGWETGSNVVTRFE